MAARRCYAMAAWEASSNRRASRKSTMCRTSSTSRTQTTYAPCNAAMSKQVAIASPPTPSTRTASNSRIMTRASMSSTQPQPRSRVMREHRSLPVTSVLPGRCLPRLGNSASRRPTISSPNKPAPPAQPVATSSFSKPSPICSKPKRRCSPASTTRRCRSS